MIDKNVSGSAVTYFIIVNCFFKVSYLLKSNYFIKINIYFYFKILENII